jgi:hypothetical protein
MERAAEEYQRAILLGAHLPPMSTIEVTVDTVLVLEGTYVRNPFTPPEGHHQQERGTHDRRFA